MSGPNNALIGDSMGIDLPETQLDEKELIEEKQMAQYTKSAEFKRIQDWCQLKIAYHQSYLPGNVPVAVVPEEERGKYWAVADLVITDLMELMDMFETATEAVEDAAKDV